MTEPERVLVVGAGIAGIACARALADAGLPVLVVDRGHRIGGRMASRTTHGRPVDVGASYFTVSDPAFEAVVDDWEMRRMARPWTDTFTVVDGGRFEPTTGPMRWRAPAGLRALVEDLASGLDVRAGLTVQQVSADDRLRVDGAAARAVVLAMPDPQARRLLDAGLAAERAALDREFEPVIALTATYEMRSWEVEGAFVNDDGVLDWVADDGRRRGDGAPVLVAHSSAAFAADHLTDPEQAAEPMQAALRVTLRLPEPQSLHVHRWTFARPASGRDEPYLLSDRNLGICGDAWSPKPRVEGAYLSGRALGLALADRLG